MTAAGARDYDALLSSGLYEDLAASGRLIPHQEGDPRLAPGAHRVLRPASLPFVSYPYEWSFLQLQDAALLTLDLLEAGLARGLILKDASAYNIQFVGSRPVLIDTLSFEIYREGPPWVAYRQFCEQFLAPLALMAYRDPRMAGLWRAHVEGVPLDLASLLLPRRTRGRLGLLTHLHVHALSQAFYARRAAPRGGVALSRGAILAVADSLRRTVRRLRPRRSGSAWIDYESTHPYAAPALCRKHEVVRRWLEAIRPRQVWDLGANTGRFSRLAAEAGAYVVSFDSDAEAVGKTYQVARTEGSRRLLPLVMDLTNPSPGLGWSGQERDSLASRHGADLILALALVHHLALGANVPLPRLARWLAELSPTVVLEFVPKEDPQADHLLRSRRDCFGEYDSAGLERSFEPYFHLHAREPLPDSSRVLYCWTRRA